MKFNRNSKKEYINIVFEKMYKQYEGYFIR
jgi:hypothetical protein